MTPEEIPQHLVDIVDRAAGKEHSRSGPVLACLAEVLTAASPPRPPELDLDWHGDAFDERIDATGHVLSFRRFGPLVNFGITPGAVTVLTAGQAEDLAANLYAAARAARTAEV